MAASVTDEDAPAHMRRMTIPTCLRLKKIPKSSTIGTVSPMIIDLLPFASLPFSSRGTNGSSLSIVVTVQIVSEMSLVFSMSGKTAVPFIIASSKACAAI